MIGLAYFLIGITFGTLIDRAREGMQILSASSLETTSLLNVDSSNAQAKSKATHNLKAIFYRSRLRMGEK